MAMLNVSIVGEIIRVFGDVRLLADHICVGIGVVQSIDERVGLAFAATADRVEGRLTAAACRFEAEAAAMALGGRRRGPRQIGTVGLI